MSALWKRRSKLDLVGIQIHTHRGRWLQTHTGIGAGVDSFYEYLLKAAILLGDDEMMGWFHVAYHAIDNHTKWSGTAWNIEVAMDTGAPHSYRISALQAFWPALQILAGDVDAARKSFEPLYTLWKSFRALPEIFDARRGRVLDFAIDSPIRPELAESTYHLYSATGDDRYLSIGKEIVFALQNISRVSCGYASIADVTSQRLDDRMDSFVLSETFKYLFLLFDASLEPAQRQSIFCPNDRAETAGTVGNERGATCLRPIRTLFSTEGHVFIVSDEIVRNNRTLPAATCGDLDGDSDAASLKKQRHDGSAPWAGLLSRSKQ